MYIAVIVPRADLKASHICLLNGSVLLTVLRRPPVVPLRGIPLPPLDELRCQAHIAVYRGSHVEGHLLSDEKWSKPRVNRVI